MLYRNVKSGAVIDVNSTLSGDWVLIEEKAPVEKAGADSATTAPKKKKKVADDG